MPVTPMRSDVARSIALVMLMIVSVQMPMFDNAEEPVELKEEPPIAVSYTHLRAHET